MRLRILARELKTYWDGESKVVPLNSLFIHHEFFPWKCPGREDPVRCLAAPWNFAPRFELALKHS